MGDLDLDLDRERERARLRDDIVASSIIAINISSGLRDIRRDIFSYKILISYQSPFRSWHAQSYSAQLCHILLQFRFASSLFGTFTHRQFTREQ
jgi:hypothetical protein